MRAQDVAKTVMRTSGVTQKELADKLGKAGPSTISMILSGRSMKVDNLLFILNECGYDLIARSRDGVRSDYLIGEGDMENTPRSDVRLRALVKSMVAEEMLKQRYGESNQLAINFAEEDNKELEPDI